jgi:hypothetical protein
LFAKPTPLNIKLSSDRFAMFNKKRDIPTAESLRTYLATTHAKIASGTGMPNPQLADYQMTEIITCILSLRLTH